MNLIWISLIKCSIGLFLLLLIFLNSDSEIDLRPDWNIRMCFEKGIKSFFFPSWEKIWIFEFGELTAINFWIWSPRFPGQRERERVWIYCLLRTRASMEKERKKDILKSDSNSSFHGKSTANRPGKSRCLKKKQKKKKVRSSSWIRLFLIFFRFDLLSSFLFLHNYSFFFLSSRF